MVPLGHIRSDHNSNTVSAFYLLNKTNGKNATGLSPSLARFSNLFHNSLNGFSIIQFQTNWMKEKAHCAFYCGLLTKPNPLSLAATNGVSVDFLSFSYLDVSVR